MKLENLSDVRAEVGRHRVSLKALAEELGRTDKNMSHLMAWDGEVILSPEAQVRWQKAILACARRNERQAVSA